MFTKEKMVRRTEGRDAHWTQTHVPVSRTTLSFFPSVSLACEVTHRESLMTLP